MDQRVRDLVVHPSPKSLTREQIDPEKNPVTEVPPEHRRDYPVVAWVDFPAMTLRPSAYAVAWNKRAVQIEFPVLGKPVRAWVWASSVESLPDNAAEIDPFGSLGEPE